MKLQQVVPAILLSAVAVTAYADDWDYSDTAREVTWQAVNVIDWGQTLDIAHKCKYSRIHERNPMLRQCPTIKEVHTHFMIGAALHYWVAQALSKQYRASYQQATVIYAVHIVGSNARMGLTVKF